MKARARLDYVEFYITNVCNLNCADCNRFNNYHFTGHQRWKDYDNVYDEWKEVVDLSYITILGGEPLLNPDINKWIKGIRNKWLAPIEITTNGTRLNFVKDLYSTILDSIYINSRRKIDIVVRVNSHNVKNSVFLDTEIQKFLSGPVKKTLIVNNDIDHIWEHAYGRIKHYSWSECKTYREFKHLSKEEKEICIENGLDDVSFLTNNSHVEYIDANNVKVVLYTEDVFYKNALNLNNGKFELHNSNPKEAHARCYSKLNHHFVNGKLYKCNVVGILPEFMAQFPFNVSEFDLNLLNSYVPLSINNINNLAQFVTDLPNEIPQCKFCPDKPMQSFKLNAVSGNKINIQKL